MNTEWTRHPHRRRNPLTGEWVLVSPHRTQRPWQGELEVSAAESLLSYDPSCYLCPGNVRANGERNPQYAATRAFDNDYPALLPEPVATPAPEPLFQAESESGLCRVLCFSPRHDLSLARMDREAILSVIKMWTEQYREVGALPFVNWVQIFENRGAIMGASNPHPHGQLWAQQTLPNEAMKEQSAQLAYREAHGSCLLCDYARSEIERGERVVFSNEHFAVFVPFWAVWPFETLLVSRTHVTALDEVETAARTDFAEAIATIAQEYDALFGVPFPYSMGFHQRPTDGQEHSEWHLHAHYYPPLLRSATIRKFFVGYELLAQPQRDITPEEAAARLRGTQSSVRANS